MLRIMQKLNAAGPRHLLHKQRDHMAFGAHAGKLFAAWRWGLLVVVACLSPSIAHAANGTFTASSDCIGGNTGFTLRNNNANASILLHDNAFVVLNQSFQVVAQPAQGPFVSISGTWQPHNFHTWTWNQKTTNNMQVP